MRTPLALKLVVVALLACIAAGPCLAREMPSKDGSASLAGPLAAQPRQNSISINDGDASVDVTTDNNGDDGDNTDSINLNDIFDSINDVIDTALNIAEDVDYQISDWLEPFYGLAKGVAEVTQDNSIYPYKSEADIPLSFYFKKLWESEVHHIASLIADHEPADDTSDDECNCDDDNCDNCDDNSDCDDDNCDYNDYKNNEIINNVAVDVFVRKNDDTTDDGTNDGANDGANDGTA